MIREQQFGARLTILNSIATSNAKVLKNLSGGPASCPKAMSPFRYPRFAPDSPAETCSVKFIGNRNATTSAAFWFPGRPERVWSRTDVPA
jgi:hypothetical protein